MTKYICFTLKISGWVLFLFFVAAIFFGLLSNNLQLEIIYGIGFTLFAIKIGILAILCPFIFSSLASFYKDIKEFNLNEFKRLAEYYEPQLIILFCTVVSISASMILDIVFFLSCRKIFWNFGLGSLISGIIGVIIFSFYLLIKGIGEVEALKEAGGRETPPKTKSK